MPWYTAEADGAVVEFPAKNKEAAIANVVRLWHPDFWAVKADIVHMYFDGNLIKLQLHESEI